MMHHYPYARGGIVTKFLKTYCTESSEIVQIYEIFRTAFCNREKSGGDTCGNIGAYDLPKVGKVAFRRIKDLISCLYSVTPGVFTDPNFLERSLVVDGVTPYTSPQDLLKIFSFVAVEAAVLVRDSETGYRVGLVVFADVLDMSAINLNPHWGLYATCIPASSHGDPRQYIRDALKDESTRRPSAELLRSLVPPQFLLEDKDKDLHLRSVFVRGVVDRRRKRGRPGGSAYGLCCLATDHLLARGYICAAVACWVEDAGLLVYDDAGTTELLARRAPRLCVKSIGLQMQDTSLLPLLQSESDLEASELRRMLPPYITQQQEGEDGMLGRRVMVLTGIDTQQCRCDAAEIAYFLQHQVGLLEVEAVIVHRALQKVVVVLGYGRDAVVVLREPPETWVHAFGQQATWTSVFVCPPPPPPPDGPASVLLLDDLQLWSPRDRMNPVDYCNVRTWIYENIGPGGRVCYSDIVHCLTGICALGNPATVWSRSFPHRALVLSGISCGTNRSDLCRRLSRFGWLDDVVYDHSTGIALVVFISPFEASRLYGVPGYAPQRVLWNHLGFTDCRPPCPEDAHVTIARRVLDRLALHL
uniref:RRM domain-containing protein n=1 Tax=Oryza brachyantha TaxID=4533 RepID=J3M2W1_ORYBR